MTFHVNDSVRSSSVFVGKKKWKGRDYVENTEFEGTMMLSRILRNRMYVA
jgi:hypothetical protein